MNTEEELRAAGHKPLTEHIAEQGRAMQELEARLRGLSREVAEASKPKTETDITVTVMTKEKLREFVREEVRKALAEAGIEPGVDIAKTVTKRIAQDWRMSAGVRNT